MLVFVKILLYSIKYNNNNLISLMNIYVKIFLDKTISLEVE
jgi:hypothetical protein